MTVSIRLIYLLIPVDLRGTGACSLQRWMESREEEKKKTGQVANASQITQTDTHTLGPLFLFFLFEFSLYLIF